jgi:hypothetical protein
MVDEPEVSIDVGIEELKKQLEAAKREKVAAEKLVRRLTMPIPPCRTSATATCC